MEEESSDATPDRATTQMDMDEDSSDGQSDVSDESDDESIDMDDYYTKVEMNKILDAKLKNIALDDYVKFDRLDHEIKLFGQEIQGKMIQTEKNIDTRVGERLNKITQDIETILKNKQREKSDLQNMNQRLIDRIDILTKKINESNESIESICTISLCLMESQCMQIRADEQDD